jgi:hypothetical protein
MFGLRLWFSVLCMFAGSAILSFYKMLNNYKPDTTSNVEEWAPFENERQGLRDAKKKSSAPIKNVAGNKNGLFEFKQPKDGSIKSIALLGERNSGTRWIYG